MQRLIGKDVSISDLKGHEVMLVIVYDLLARQAQPRFITEASATKVVFDMRNNISKMQMQRLITEPLNASLPEYQWSINTTDRSLTASLKVKANAKGKKANAVNEQTDASTVSGVEAA